MRRGQEILRFADFEIQPDTARLLRDGRPIPLEPRAFDLLLLLVRSGGRLVEKEEIMQAVWNGAFVTDNALTRSVARLRKALGDSAKAPRFIETAHSRGYRFLARVETVDDDSGAVEPARGGDDRPRRLSWLAAALAAGLLSLALPALWIRFRAPVPVREPVAETLDLRRVAILPLENLSGGEDDDYFVNGLTEQIISNLAQIGGLRVLAKTTTDAYRDAGRIAEIARELRAGTVLEGSARRSGDKLRIHVQLIHGESEEHLWSGEFDRSVEDLFVTQSEIATRVAEALHLTISPSRMARMRSGPTPHLSAYDLYLRGRDAYRKRTQAGNEEAIEFYQTALELDPDFALAEAGLANAHAIRATWYGFGRESEDEAVMWAERALDVNPELPEAFKALGIVAFKQDRFRDAIEWNRRALELNPSYDEATYNLSSVLHVAGRWDEAVRIHLRETGRTVNLSALAAQLLLLGFGDQGTAVAERALATDPFPLYLTGQLALYDAREGDLESARERMAGLRRARPDWAGSWEVSGEIALLAGDLAAATEYFEKGHDVWKSDDFDPLLNLARARWTQGDRAVAESLFSEVEAAVLPRIEQGSEYWHHFWTMAAIESMRGNVEGALDWYEQAVDWGHRTYWSDEADATLAPLRKSRRFQAQIDRMRDSVSEMRVAVQAEVVAATARLLAE